MHALLDLIRDNEAAVQEIKVRCRALLKEACTHLKVLFHGEKELMLRVLFQMAKLVG